MKKLITFLLMLTTLTIRAVNFVTYPVKEVRVEYPVKDVNPSYKEASCDMNWDNPQLNRNIQFKGDLRRVSYSNGQFVTSPVKESQKSIKSLGGGSSINTSNFTKNLTPAIYNSSTSFAATPPDWGHHDQTCPYCGGDGVINDNGDGELIYGTWYFQSNGRGDGTSCTNTTGYHDPCDGETIHHFAETKCPYCNGTGKNPHTVSGWTTWTGEAWSHPWSDEDRNGHCDEHYWHAPIGDGAAIMIVLALCYCLFLLIKTDSQLDQN